VETEDLLVSKVGDAVDEDEEKGLRGLGECVI
jgi:hypothetical protein